MVEKILNKSTLIPVSAISTMGGGMIWLTSVFVEVRANTDHIKAVEAQLVEVDNKRSKMWDNLRDQTSSISDIKVTTGKTEAKIDLIYDLLKTHQGEHAKAFRDNLRNHNP